MIQTINIINTQNPSSRKRIAVCNLTFETTATEDQVESALEKALPIAFDKIKKNHSPANMAMVMQAAVEMAQEKYPDLYLSDVNDNPAKSKQVGAINFEVAYACIRYFTAKKHFQRESCPLQKCFLIMKEILAPQRNRKYHKNKLSHFYPHLIAREYRPWKTFSHDNLPVSQC